MTYETMRVGLFSPGSYSPASRRRRACRNQGVGPETSHSLAPLALNADKRAEELRHDQLRINACQLI